MPSCMRAPPEHDTMSSGIRFRVASSIARVIFSPTTEAMLPPMNANSKTHTTTGCPPIRPTPETRASSRPVFSRDDWRRSA